MLAWASGRFNPFIRLLKNNAFKDDAERANRVVRYGYIHDPGIQQEPPDNVHVTVLPESEDHLFIVIPPLSSEAASTGVARMADLSPAYGGPDGPAYGGSNPMSATGIDRLADLSPAYAGRPRPR
jgi:hypothetical protein